MVSVQKMEEFCEQERRYIQQEKSSASKANFEECDKRERRLGVIQRHFQNGVERALAAADAAKKEAEGTAEYAAAHAAAEAAGDRAEEKSVMQPIHEWQRDNSHCLSPSVTTMWLHDKEVVEKVGPYE
jgi:hypothetical protein